MLKVAAEPDHLSMPTAGAPDPVEISLEIETKKCPARAETVKLEALKCRFCGLDLDLEEVDQQVPARRTEFADILEKNAKARNNVPNVATGTFAGPLSKTEAWATGVTTAGSL